MNEAQIKKLAELITGLLQDLGKEKFSDAAFFGVIPAKKLGQAKLAMGVQNDEQVILLYDDTVFGSAKEGILITSWGVRQKSIDSTWNLPWNRLQEFTFGNVKGVLNKQLPLISKDGEEKTLYSTSGSIDLNILKKIIQDGIEICLAGEENAIAKKPAAKPPAQSAAKPGCAQCGAALAADALFCPKCGAKVQAEEAAFCSKCGNKLKADAKFCPKCGTKTGGEEPPANETPAPPAQTRQKAIAASGTERSPVSPEEAKALANLKQFLAEGGDVNKKAENGLTALMAAAANGCGEIVKLLIEAGADVNAEMNDGSTALIFAAHEKHNDVVQLLIKADADTSAQEE
jgi:RNA polymerase subunit RPABC4/transcription elongation factor Spt4